MADELNFRIIPGRTDHMIPHVPTAEMVRLHPCHVDGPTGLCFTGTRAECEAYIARRIAKSAA
jgi:hypothetical protein